MQAIKDLLSCDGRVFRGLDHYLYLEAPQTTMKISQRHRRVVAKYYYCAGWLSTVAAYGSNFLSQHKSRPTKSCMPETTATVPNKSSSTTSTNQLPLTYLCCETFFAALRIDSFQFGYGQTFSCPCDILIN